MVQIRLSIRVIIRCLVMPHVLSQCAVQFATTGRTYLRSVVLATAIRVFVVQLTNWLLFATGSPVTVSDRYSAPTHRDKTELNERDMVRRAKNLRI